MEASLLLIVPEAGPEGWRELELGFLGDEVQTMIVPSSSPTLWAPTVTQKLKMTPQTPKPPRSGQEQPAGYQGVFPCGQGPMVLVLAGVDSVLQDSGLCYFEIQLRDGRM